MDLSTAQRILQGGGRLQMMVAPPDFDFTEPWSDDDEDREPEESDNGHEELDNEEDLGGPSCKILPQQRPEKRQKNREQLSELGTGIADDGEHPLLQDEEIAAQVRATDCSASRNILRLRQNLVAGEVSASVAPRVCATAKASSTPLVGPTTSATAVRGPLPATAVTSAVQSASTVASAPTVLLSTPTTPASAARAPTTPTAPAHALLQVPTLVVGSSSSSQKMTKSDMLMQQSEAVCSIARNFHEATQKQILLVETKKRKAESQNLLMDAKRKKHQLALLKEAKEHGLLTQEEFEDELRNLMKL